MTEEPIKCLYCKRKLDNNTESINETFGFHSFGRPLKTCRTCKSRGFELRQRPEEKEKRRQYWLKNKDQINEISREYTKPHIVHYSEKITCEMWFNRYEGTHTTTRTK